ncbi:MAG: HdeD family acid-resistance protein [Pseudomonadota bacterium]
MKEMLSRSWWLLALRGVVAILFGALAIMWPDLTLLTLVALFAVYAILSGAVSIFAALKHRKSNDDWWIFLLFGVVSVGAGLIAVAKPMLTALVLVLLMGANALITGVLDIAAAIRLRKTIHNEWLLILSGIVSIVFGTLVFIFPEAGALAMVWLISLYAVVGGVLLLALAVRMRKLALSEGPERRITPDRRVSAAH